MKANLINVCLAPLDGAFALLPKDKLAYVSTVGLCD